MVIMSRKAVKPDELEIESVIRAARGLFKILYLIESGQVSLDAEDARAMTRRNSMTSPYLWMLCISSLVPAVLFWDSTLVLLMWLVLFCLVYVVLYWRIVRFKTPRVLTATRRRVEPPTDAEPVPQED